MAEVTYLEALRQGLLEEMERDEEVLLLGEGWATDDDLDAVGQRVSQELDAAVAECEDDPLPEGTMALSQVYASPPDEERLWFRRLDG